MSQMPNLGRKKQGKYLLGWLATSLALMPWRVNSHPPPLEMDIEMETSNCKVKCSFVNTVDDNVNAGVDLDAGIGAGAGAGAGTDKGNSDNNNDDTDDYEDSKEENSKDKDSEDKDSEDEDSEDKIDQPEDVQDNKGDKQQNEANNKQHNNVDNELHNNTTNDQSNDDVIMSNLMGSILVSRKTCASTAHSFHSKEANADWKQRIKNRWNVVSFFSFVSN